MAQNIHVDSASITLDNQLHVEIGEIFPLIFYEILSIQERHKACTTI